MHTARDVLLNVLIYVCIAAAAIIGARVLAWQPWAIRMRARMRGRSGTSAAGRVDGRTISSGPSEWDRRILITTRAAREPVVRALQIRLGVTPIVGDPPSPAVNDGPQTFAAYVSSDSGEVRITLDLHSANYFERRSVDQQIRLFILDVEQMGTDWSVDGFS